MASSEPQGAVPNVKQVSAAHNSVEQKPQQRTVESPQHKEKPPSHPRAMPQLPDPSPITPRLELLAKPRVRPPPPDPVEQSYLAGGAHSKHNKSPPRKVTGCSPRLAGPKLLDIKDLPPLVQKKVIDAEELQKHIEHVYSNPLAKAKKEEEQRAELYHTHTAKTVKMQQESIAECVERLAVTSVRVHEKEHEALQQKYLDSRRAKPPPPEAASPEGQAALVTRLYTESIKHQQDLSGELGKTWCHGPISARRTDGQWKDTITRLASPRSSNRK